MRGCLVADAGNGRRRISRWINGQNEGVVGGVRSVTHGDGDRGGAVLTGSRRDGDRPIGPGAAEGNVGVGHQANVGGGSSEGQDPCGSLGIADREGDWTECRVLIDGLIGNVGDGWRGIGARTHREDEGVSGGVGPIENADSNGSGSILGCGGADRNVAGGSGSAQSNVGVGQQAGVGRRGGDGQVGCGRFRVADREVKRTQGCVVKDGLVGDVGDAGRAVPTGVTPDSHIVQQNLVEDHVRRPGHVKRPDIKLGHRAVTCAGRDAGLR